MASETERARESELDVVVASECMSHVKFSAELRLFCRKPTYSAHLRVGMN